MIEIKKGTTVAQFKAIVSNKKKAMYEMIQPTENRLNESISNLRRSLHFDSLSLYANDKELRSFAKELKENCRARIEADKWREEEWFKMSESQRKKKWYYSLYEDKKPSPPDYWEAEYEKYTADMETIQSCLDELKMFKLHRLGRPCRYIVKAEDISKLVDNEEIIIVP